MLITEKVLVTGIGGPAGRSAVDFFRGKGCVVVGTDLHAVEGADMFHTVPPALDPEFPASILEIVDREGPTLVVPTVTEELVVMAGIADSIRKAGAGIFISAVEAVEIAASKLRTATVLAEKGVAVPVTLPGEEAKEKVLAEIGLPLLAKPDFSRGGRGINVIGSAEELDGETRRGIIFQEFIPGEEFDANLFVGGSGEVLASVVLKKTLLKEGITGNAAGVERVEREDVGMVAERAARMVGLTGPLDIDIRLRDDGTPVVLEINARLGGNVLSAPEVLETMYISWKEKGGYI